MKRTILSLLIVLLATIPLYADEQPAITYDLAADTFADMLELLDQAIYLSAGAILADSRTESKSYVQDLVNLLEGPETDTQGTAAEWDAGNGIIPLFDALHLPGTDAIPYQALFPDLSSALASEWSVFWSWRQVDVLLSQALAVAQELLGAPYSYPWEEQLNILYAVLVTTRGGYAHDYPMGGVAALVDIFPQRETWVGATSSIQDAIDRTPEGGTVYLEPGIYREAIVIEKSLCLVAAPGNGEETADLGEVVFSGHLYGCAITIRSDVPIDVSIRGVHVTGNECGIGVGEGATVALSDVRFEQNDSSLYVTDGCSVQAEACTFTANHEGIRVYSNSSVTMRNCLIEGTTGWSGAVQFSCSSLIIEDCNIVDNNGPGLKVGPSGTTLHLVNSIVARNGRGIQASTGDCNDYMVRYGSFADITGWGNVIPDTDEPDENEFGAFDAFSPAGNLDLAFLTEPKPEDE